jgi:uncharacterized protein
MPANLTHPYWEAGSRFKQARTAPEKIKILEEMLAMIPKHKGNEKLRDQLKNRMDGLNEGFSPRHKYRGFPLLADLTAAPVFKRIS